MADELANPSVALRTWLRESAALESVLGGTNKIYIDWPRDKNDNTKITVPRFTNVVVIFPGRGGRGSLGSGQYEERIDIGCYGEDPAKCYKIWRVLDFYLLPVNVRRKTSFTRNGCQVNFVSREGGPLRLFDIDLAHWPYTLAPYLINYNGEQL